MTSDARSDATADESGDYVGGRFLPPEGAQLTSHDPAREARIVFSTRENMERVALAVEHAREAQPGWNALGLAGRWATLRRFRAAIEAKREAIADAIVREMGKIRSEARLEVASLVGRFDLSLDRVKNDLSDGPLPGFPNEALRWQPHGVVGVIGPFNFPVHLSHAHIVPALLLGNTVVLKPSELTPLCAVRYLEAAHEAGLPSGVLNLVQGRAASGMALVLHHDVKAIAFTGSWPVGRRILEATLDKPETLLALEMGGKNVSIVCEDADLRQAAHEIVIGGYLTTGQRCTCTDRVLVHKSKLKALRDALRHLVSGLVFGDPDDPRSFAGPMASEGAVTKLERAIERARQAGADAVVPGERKGGGAFRTGSIHVLPAGLHHVPGYTDVELFGPDLGVEAFDDDDEAIAITAGSPYGFACSVFTGSDARFARYRSRIRLGLLNHNRSTNQASPRLPFGGTGRSGNFRPAGAFAARNLAVPVAVQSNALFSITVSPHLRPNLPPPDLDLMERRHVLEEASEAEHRFTERPRPLHVTLPSGGAVPSSTAWLARLEAGERVRAGARVVFDHRGSLGPLVASVDALPRALLDTTRRASALGLSDEALVRAYVDGAFSDTMLRAHDRSVPGPGEELAAALSMALRARVPGLPTVSFAACADEANETALALARLHAGPNANRYVLVAHAADASFEVTGETRVLVPLPFVESADNGQFDEPADFAALTRASGAADVTALDALTSHDPLLSRELGALRLVAHALATKDVFAVRVAPCELAGLVRATARFHRALHLLTRAFGVAHVMDETAAECGGSSPLHHAFELRSAAGAPSEPDLVTLGGPQPAVLSRYPDPEPGEGVRAAHVRARLELGLGNPDDHAKLQQLLAPELALLDRRFSEWARRVTVSGSTLAFELPSDAHRAAYVAQQYFRGVLVEPVGPRGVCYRLNRSFDRHTVRRLFVAITQSLAWLEAHPGKLPPAWEDLVPPDGERDRLAWPGGTRETVLSRSARGLRHPHAPPSDPTPATGHLVGPEHLGDTGQRAEGTSPVTVRVAQPSEPSLMDRIVALEAEANEAPSGRLTQALKEPELVLVVAERDQGRVLVGFAVAVPLESVEGIDGPDRDPARGRRDTLYALALTVRVGERRIGLGRRLKVTLLEAARARRSPSTGARYRWLTGTNPLASDHPLCRINDALGAFTVFHLSGPSAEPDPVLRYYRQPVHALSANEVRVARPAGIDCASGLVAPFAEPPSSLIDAERGGLLLGPTIQQLPPSRFVTPPVVRAAEWLSALAPDLPHLAVLAGRDAMVDRVTRLLRQKRPSGTTVVTLAGTYVGHGMAASRWISDPSTHLRGATPNDVVRVPHPEAVGADSSMSAIRAAVDRLGNDAILGVVLEAVGERTGLVVSDAFLAGLASLRKDRGIPVVLVETASACYRSGRGAFFSSGVDFLPDALGWWSGGGAAVLHLGATLFAASDEATWSGDELALIQTHHVLRAARGIDVANLGARLEDVLARALGPSGISIGGAGLYRVLRAGDGAALLATRLLERGIRVKSHPAGHLAIAPALDLAEVAIEKLAAALA